MRQLLYSIFLLFLTAAAAHGQGKFNGRIFEIKTRVGLFGIRVENLRSHTVTGSDSTGKFSIAATAGDVISFSGGYYKPDTIYLTDLKYLEVNMEPRQNMLNEVKVTTPDVKTGNLTAPPPVHILGANSLRYQTDGAGNYIGGMKIMLFDWDNTKKKSKGTTDRSRQRAGNRNLKSF